MARVRSTATWVDCRDAIAGTPTLLIALALVGAACSGPDGTDDRADAGGAAGRDPGIAAEESGDTDPRPVDADDRGADDERAPEGPGELDTGASEDAAPTEGFAPSETTVTEYGYTTRDFEAETDAQIACIEAEGYAVRRINGGFQYIASPGDDQEARREVFDACREQYAAPAPDATPEWFSRLYDAKVLAAQCLRDQGANVPEPPSRDAWIEDPSSWSPYASIGVIAGYSQAENERLIDACPQPWVE